MKKIILISLVSVLSNVSFASKGIDCLDFAEDKLVEYLEISKADFRETNSLIYTCKPKNDLNSETIQFGDGSGLGGVEVTIKNGKCTVKDIYTGQDDQDGDPEEDKKLCTPESLVENVLANEFNKTCLNKAQNAVERKTKGKGYDKGGIEALSCNLAKNKKAYICEVSASKGDGAATDSYRAILNKSCSRAYRVDLTGEE